MQRLGSLRKCAQRRAGYQRQPGGGRGEEASMPVLVMGGEEAHLSLWIPPVC